MKQPYNTALYMRLSRDDENYGDSVSIETQRLVLNTYAREQGFFIVDEYVDDGWSGTNFERPGFQRMLQDIEAGKVNCVLVKDLSRFGREHVMMDYYLEFYFPEKQIRFIAITDNEDTEKGLTDIVPVKNLFNEFWAKDTSRKVKAAIHAKHAAGECTATKPPFGYIKDPEHKNHIIIDEETRWIIEKMFDMAAHGAGMKRIAQALAKEKIPTPGFTAYQRSGLYANIYQDAPPEKAYAWSISVVSGILKDETYIGNSVHNKQTTVSYKNKKRLNKPSDDWFRVEGTHEPIIDADVFWQVQEQIGNRRRAMKDAEPQIFAGLLKCADCGKAMVVSSITARACYRYYNCNNYRKYSRITGACSSHSIRYDVLYQHILSRIQYWIEQAHTDEQELLQKLLSTTDQERRAVLKKQAAELKKAEKRKEDVDRRFAKVYEDWADERITEYNFKMLSQKYQAEQQEIEEKISQLQASIEKEHQNVEDAEKWINLVKQYEYPTELTVELLNTLIEKILIHEPVKLASGYRDQEIEIFYRFVGKLD